MQQGSVFQLQGSKFGSLPVRSMRDGFYGEQLEAALQRLLQEHPEIIPGDQLEPYSEDPPRFLLLKRETQIGSWSLDHLFVDHNGLPTLVECKLIQNPQSRREVIGQIIEYAANAQVAWGDGSLRQIANKAWSDQGTDLSEALATMLGVEDEDEFWEKVNQNLEAGRIRLIIAGDEIRPEVRRMIEYLNNEMHRVEVFGLENKCYGINDENIVMVSNVVGRSQRSIDNSHKQTTSGRSQKWGVDELKAKWQTSETDEAEVFLNTLLSLAVKRDRFAPNRSIGPSFNLSDVAGRSVLAVYSGAEVWTKASALTNEENHLLQQRLLDAGFLGDVDINKKQRKLLNLDAQNIDRIVDILMK